MLYEAAIAEAKKLGGSRVFLESNTVLKPAIKLYRSLGFREIPVENPEYERVDIQMELALGRRRGVSIIFNPGDCRWKLCAVKNRTFAG